MTQKGGVQMGPPKINKRTSKKLKSSWRKNVDMTEADEALEVERFEKRMGGSFAERESKDLFVMDVDGADNAKSGQNDVMEKKEKKFKSFANLEGLPGAPDPIAKRNPGSNKPKTLTGVALKRKLNQQKIRSTLGKAMRAKHLLEKQIMDENVKKSKHRREKFDFDIWEQEDKKDLNMESVWVKDETRTHTDLHSRKFKANKIRNKKPKTLVPTIEFPHSGQSYNPTLEDHQDILWKAAYAEMKKEKEERRLNLSLTAMFPTKADAPTQKSYMEEMSVGIPEIGGKEEEIDEENEAADDNEEDKFVHKEAKPKTMKQRRDAKLRKMEEAAVLKEKKDRLELQKIVSLKTWKKEFKAMDEMTVKRQAKKAEDAIEKLKGPVKIGNYKYKPDDIEIKLSDELSGNLRNLKPEGNALQERYKSLQRRNIIEPRQKQKRVKPWTKKVDIRRHKMGFEEEEAKYRHTMKTKMTKKAQLKGAKRKTHVITTM